MGVDMGAVAAVNNSYADKLKLQLYMQKELQDQRIRADAASGANALDFARAKETPLDGESTRQLRVQQGGLFDAQADGARMDTSLAPSIFASEDALRKAQGTNLYATARNTNFTTDSGVADANDPYSANGMLNAMGLPTLSSPGNRARLSAPRIGVGSPTYKLPAFNMPQARRGDSGFDKNEFGVKTRRSSIGGQGGMIEIR